MSEDKKKKLVKDTIEIECLIHALSIALEAKIEHDKARDEYDGYSWGYYGRSYVKNMEETANDFGLRLDALIENKIKNQLEKQK